MGGATVNAAGRPVVRATRVGADTALAQIARLVTEAQSGKAPVQRLADRVSAVFVPVVIALAVGTLGFWLGAGETAAATMRMAEELTAAGIGVTVDIEAGFSDDPEQVGAYARRLEDTVAIHLHTCRTALRLARARAGGPR